METLKQSLKLYFNAPDTQLTAIALYFEHTTLSKGEYYVKSQQQCRTMSFVEKGFLRVYESHHDKEVTQWITTPGYFITDITSFMFQLPARRHIQALTDCALYTITQTNYQQLTTLIPEWHRLEQVFLSKCFAMMEDRIFGFLSMTAEERYQTFFAQQSELFNEVPLQYLASMMGMTPETLSRLRKKSLF